jgi:hypothetical protein
MTRSCTGYSTEITIAFSDNGEELAMLSNLVAIRKPILYVLDKCVEYKSHFGTFGAGFLVGWYLFH